MSWTVVIPSASADKVVGAVKSIFKTHPNINPSRVIVVDDGIRAIARRLVPAGVIWAPGLKPFLFARNVNVGARIGSPDDLVIMRDDVRVTTDHCFDQLSGRARSNPEYAIISPSLTALPVPPPPVTWAGLREEPASLAFACVFIPRSLWSRLGELDAGLAGSGPVALDYCKRALSAGLKLGIDTEAAVDQGVEEPAAQHR